MSMLRISVGMQLLEMGTATMSKKKLHHAVKLDKVVDGKIADKLSAAGVDRVGQVRKMTDAELKALPGIGPKAVEAIRTAVGA